MILLLTKENIVNSFYDDKTTLTPEMVPDFSIKYVSPLNISLLPTIKTLDGYDTIIGVDLTGNPYVTDPPKSENQILQEQIEFLTKLLITK